MIQPVKIEEMNTFVDEITKINVSNSQLINQNGVAVLNFKKSVLDFNSNYDRICGNVEIIGKLLVVCETQNSELEELKAKLEKSEQARRSAEESIAWMSNAIEPRTSFVMLAGETPKRRNICTMLANMFK